MEPFRPLVDRAVAGFGLRDAQVPDLDPATKRRLLQALVERVRVRDEQRSPSDIAEHMVRSLARVVDGDADRMWVPLFAL